MLGRTSKKIRGGLGLNVDNQRCVSNRHRDNDWCLKKGHIILQKILRKYMTKKRHCLVAPDYATAAIVALNMHSKLDGLYHSFRQHVVMAQF